MKHQKRLAITLGDPAGIGPEILLKVLKYNHGDNGSQHLITIYGSQAGLSILPAGDIAYKFCGNKLMVGSCEVEWVDPSPEISPENLQLGKPSAVSGKCAIDAVRLAARDILSGRADAMLTLPMCKAAVKMSGQAIPGHTELLKEISGSARVQMAFVGPRLKIALHSTHQSLRSAIDGLNAETVAGTLKFVAEQFSALFGINKAKIALCALNPHAGECGLFGDEEKLLGESVVIAQESFCGKSGFSPIFAGPFPADTLFQRAAKGEFDAVVALYHDQGMIPVKLLEPDLTVNLSLGLPFIRTSPGHGTAFDIAGKWAANPSNAIEALKLALSLTR